MNYIPVSLAVHEQAVRLNSRTNVIHVVRPKLQSAQAASISTQARTSSHPILPKQRGSAEAPARERSSTNADPLPQQQVVSGGP